MHFPELRGRAGVAGQWVWLGSPALEAGRVLCLLKCCLGSSPRWAVSQGCCALLCSGGDWTDEQPVPAEAARAGAGCVQSGGAQQAAGDAEERPDWWLPWQPVGCSRARPPLQGTAGTERPAPDPQLSGLKVGWGVSHFVGKKSRCCSSCQGCVTACMLRMEGWLCRVQGKERKEHTLSVPFLSAKFGD